MNKHWAILVMACCSSFGAQAAGGSWAAYAGADYLLYEASIERNEANGQTLRVDGDGAATRLRAGVWLNEDFALELQGHVSSDDAGSAGDAELDSYYGVFINARAQPFEWLDVLFPIGYASVDAVVTDQIALIGGGSQVVTMDASDDSVAFGMNMQFKLGEMMTDRDSLMAGLGLGLGFMVYNVSDKANVRGYNAGLHFTMDF